MSRIRSIKPEFFTDEDVAGLSPWAQLLFIALWTHADKAGRLEDRPARIKVCCQPYSSQKIYSLLAELVRGGFIYRYTHDGKGFIQIRSWTKHQLCHRDEPSSSIPAPDGRVDPPMGIVPNDTIRARIYQRDAFLCAYCGRDMRNDVRARCVDHVWPLSYGGTHHEDNLVTACKPCNAKKAGKSPTDLGWTWPSQASRYEHAVNGEVNGPLTGGATPVDSDATSCRNGKGVGNGIGKKEERQEVAAFADAWNAHVTAPIGHCRELTPARRKLIAARLKEHPLDDWVAIFDRINASPFCRGENDRGWHADFDWVLKPEVRAKVSEGKYDPRPTVPPVHRPPAQVSGRTWQEERAAQLAALKAERGT